MMTLHISCTYIDRYAAKKKRRRERYWLTNLCLILEKLFVTFYMDNEIIVIDLQLLVFVFVIDYLIN